MSVRYNAEFLLWLRESPLCVKPLSLPPAEEWMGPPPETFRNQTKTTNDRIKGPESALLNQENRRPPLDRNGTRNSTNPDDIILGPPKTNFASATSIRNSRTSEQERGLKDADRSDRPTDRFNFRTLTSDGENSSDRFRDNRDGRNNTFRRRGDQDQDSEGWSTVKPRKSFGHEGTERFHGRMGAGERFNVGREDRRPRDRDDRDNGDRRNNRNLDHGRDKDGDHLETTPRRNGMTRGKTEPWFKDSPSSTANNDAPISQRERIDRAKSWRDRDPEEKTVDRYSDRNNERNHDRRWDRDQRVERDPEWFGEAVEEKPQAHTAEDFKKFMESMKASKGGAPKAEERASAVVDTPTPFQEPEKVSSPPALESGPDKFFTAFSSGSLDAGMPGESKEASKPKAGKSSRFMAFLAPQEESRAKTEPPTPAASGAPPSAAEAPPKSEAEKEAFALLIQKLHRSGLGPSQEPSGQPQQGLARFFDSPAPPQPQQQQQQQPKSTVASPEPFQQYGGDRREDPRIRGTPQQPSVHEMISPRPMGPPTQTPVSRPEQALQDLLAQRHPLPPQAGNRGSQGSPAVNSNTEFLMRLMQSHRDPEPPRPEQLLVRMPQPTKQVSLANIPDREQDFQRDRGVPQRQIQQRPGPPGFMDEQFHPEMDSRPQQPTQILQRPPPPGLDHHMLPFPMGGIAGGNGNGGGQMPPQQRPMIPPPGLVNGPPPRNGPMPGMFPPNFPPVGGFPGPHPGEGLVGPGPPRSMQPPPGFFPGGPPPPGFLPPGMSVGGYQGGPDGGPPGVFGGGLPPFDRRGMLPPGAYRGGP